MCKRSGGELNALLRTTVAFTQMQGSKASNVIPPSASLVSNIRLNPEDTMESAVGRIGRIVGNGRVELVKLRGMGVRTAAEGVKGYYPAFDPTPPRLISGIVTDRGVFSPYDLHRYFEGGGTGEYEMVI